jgi:hypothetical protein
LRRRGEVEVEMLLLGEADELPLVGEISPVVHAQVVEHSAARRANAQRLLEQFHQLLVGQPARERLRGWAQERQGAGQSLAVVQTADSRGNRLGTLVKLPIAECR